MTPIPITIVSASTVILSGIAIPVCLYMSSGPHKGLCLGFFVAIYGSAFLWIVASSGALYPTSVKHRNRRNKWRHNRVSVDVDNQKTARHGWHPCWTPHSMEAHLMSSTRLIDAQRDISKLLHTVNAFDTVPKICSKFNEFWTLKEEDKWYKEYQKSSKHIISVQQPFPNRLICCEILPTWANSITHANQTSLHFASHGLPREHHHVDVYPPNLSLAYHTLQGVL